MTRAGSPLAGSVKLADPPTGTTDAGPTAVPDGAPAVVGVLEPPVVGVLEPPAVGAVEPDPPPERTPEPLAEEEVPPATRPIAAASPLATTTTAAAIPAMAPFESTVRRGTAPRRTGRGGGCSASEVSSAGAPAAPAKASGVQAKKKTMSEPVKYGDAWKLTVKKRPKDKAIPATAATRIHRPANIPRPMATSPRA